MGYDVDVNARGTYFGNTNARAPYCIAEKSTPSLTEPGVFNTTSSVSEEAVQFNVTVEIPSAKNFSGTP